MKNLLILTFILLLCFSCKPPEARLPESVQSGSFLKASAERNKKLNELEHQQIQDIIESNPDKEYIASESGFWYYYQTKIESDTIQPQFGDVIHFTFDVSNIEGDEIYAETNKTYIMDKEELFTGLREGLKLLKPTETATFIFPSQKAYGYYGDEGKVGTNVPLICEVTLNTITKKND
ncbi:gliding motility-associated peptidyl-prolyl isomerase GldI [Winogradskyella psychrotolerans]|uniref:gliding motility-associated peptidyl-prolyl isomerase GldI n=1 Tax=Winogradskyella psychrotolerans TaxID=1344585 RepID=UPI001C07D9B8|nr:gliding motility-associated peptidyl-prolyl isomerase GldI [Winogradskyella psychrotolerans]MBU2928938.1 gliding motility-associated peptidyl-prolyl isomerase GldI [Winogradskyella psychrotolerans]